MSEEATEPKMSDHLEALEHDIVAKGAGTDDQRVALRLAIKAIKKREREEAANGKFSYRDWV